MSFTGVDAEKNLEEFSRFTALMVCIVAAISAFAPTEVVKSVLRKVLLDLIQTSEFGEDVLASQYIDRVNAWRSAADVRGLSSEARSTRQQLLDKGVVLDGLMPPGDSPLMVQFLVWLLASNKPNYITPSSDVAGVGVCFSNLGIDMLSVGGLGVEPIDTPCRLDFCPNVAFQSNTSDKAAKVSNVLSRVPSTTISLHNPEESCTKFPTDVRTSNRCRDAWVAGQKAAKYVACLPKVPDGSRDTSSDDLQFVFYNKGLDPVRTRTGIGSLVEAHAFVMNREVCQCLETVLQRESNETVEWLLDQTIESFNTTTQIHDPKFQDTDRINAFTVFQAFFMGYYYKVLLRLVDVSSLQLQVIDGAWGYRNTQFLCRMRTLYLSPDAPREPGILLLRREDVISMLSTLLSSTARTITRIKRKSQNKDNWCIGVIGKRALLARSLLNCCRTRRDIASFILLDIDVSGIPCDLEGLVRPGVGDDRVQYYFGFTRPTFQIPGNLPSAPTEDVSFHIEADWDGDPETTLLCVRYKGRRINTINPAVADAIFCQSLVAPVSKCLPSGNTSTLQWTAQDCLNLRPIPPNGRTAPYILKIPDRPRLRYAALYWYDYRNIIRAASNCLQTAIMEAKTSADKRRYDSYVVITGNDMTSSQNEELPEEIVEKVGKLERKNRMDPSRTFQTPLGDSRLPLAAIDSDPD
ncbi:MAG: hypothetical protein LQ346_001181 [Caloplaca aetnensis]|nr:MAG: hypothetical protein LQ346_001181 [Caloplaca aetnensis]